MAYVFGFDHDHGCPPMGLKGLLGGKGANLAEMTSVLDMPVPPGFTISTEACVDCMAGGWPDGLTEEIATHLAVLEESTGRRLGDPDDPLLISVRSGARFSMPGMMDTVLNLGLNDGSVDGLTRHTDDRRFALDSYRRLIQMYGRIVMGVDGQLLEEVFERAKSDAGAVTDAEIGADALSEIIRGYLGVIESTSGEPFPQTPHDQLRGAVEAVFASWNSDRAQAYRRREHIADDLGTAVNVQVMVYGNRDDNSGTGVGFTRNPSTGEKVPYGDFLVNAQGEDVVAGIRATLPLAAMGDRFPDIYVELIEIFDRLEAHYRDMLDTEFTIEQGRLWMLQVRVGKRTGLAALRMAVEMSDPADLALIPAEAVLRVDAEHLGQVLHPQFGEIDKPVLATGLAASPGAAVGRVYFSAEDVVAAVDRGENAILVRVETSPEDVHGLEAAQGVLTSRGGLVSHAAVVARGWGKPAVCGAAEVEVGDRSFSVGDTTVHEGEVVSIDGTTGSVYLGELQLALGEPPAAFDQVLDWADQVRGDELGVRANADNGPDAQRARDYGAEGIGLARTEHMFLGRRLPMVQRMILAEGDEEENAALAELLEVQQRDFEELLEVMDGLPTTIRLLDPPLHEFLPDIDELAVEEAGGRLDEHQRRLFRAARSWHEDNPMLGTRGVRLGILKGGLYRMQVKAIARAARARKEAGGDPRPEIMIPLVVTRAELALARRWVEESLDEELGPDRGGLTIKVGTMIETPRAAVRADEIAEEADFFSFGTNDLTQMTFGFSRDDIESRMMPRYLEEGLLTRNPFESIDEPGVGELVRLGVRRGRLVKPSLSTGVCGEHGGDPDSIAFFYDAGLDYVSCSPFRVPVARLAAAQAVARASASD